MKPSHAISALLLAFVIALAAGCSSAPAKSKATPTATAPVPNPPAAGPQCTNDEQCGLGACGRCENGACIRIDGCCNADNDCAPGSRCRAGRCR